MGAKGGDIHLVWGRKAGRESSGKGICIAQVSRVEDRITRIKYLG